uniref:Amino acid transporter transmembrane domain-containing protein n=1 Tax=Zooxanthella nutricula TaxID=1333877 RepID=A0A7S2JNV6_9DINO|mmetsp:Transcript_34071/g.102893  ORF Transcript_34071/g.102893 Transcript_34071/m.102893 type:complete len:469 (+) Transcript_34071:49-1455(+)
MGTAGVELQAVRNVPDVAPKSSFFDAIRPLAKSASTVSEALGFYVKQGSAGNNTSCPRKAALDLEPEAQRTAETGPQRGSSNLVTALLLLKSTIGGTLIIIPNSFKSAGILPAAFVLLGVCATEVFCMVLLVQCRQTVGAGAYGDLAELSMGKFGRLAVDISMVTSQLGFTCAEMLYMGKNLHGFFEGLEVFRGGSVPTVESIIAMQVLFSLPTSWIRRLEYFKWTNAIANVAVLVALAMITLGAIAGLARDGNGPDVQLHGGNWLLFVGTAVFSFECINFVLPTYEEHEDKSSFTNVLAGTLGVVVLVFLAFGVVNYACYGADTKPSVTLNLPSDSTLGKTVPLIISVCCLLNVPLFLFPASITIEAKALAGEMSARTRMWCMNGLRTSLVLVCTLVAILGAKQLEAMIAFIGAFCCVPLAYIYPALAHLRLCRPGRLWAAVDVSLVLMGGVVFVATSADAIRELRG